VTREFRDEQDLGAETRVTCLMLALGVIDQDAVTRDLYVAMLARLCTFGDLRAGDVVDLGGILNLDDAPCEWS
jgi:hypothetical protein